MLTQARKFLRQGLGTGKKASETSLGIEAWSHIDTRGVGLF